MCVCLSAGRALAKAMELHESTREQTLQDIYQEYIEQVIFVDE
jgi:hypothetical protein